MQNFIPYGKQSIDSDDTSAVTKALNKKFITTGPGVELFEKSFQSKLGSKYAVSSNSGTSAIFLALKAINVKNNDTIIIPSINFIAAANLVKILRARVVFADVNSTTGQMTPKNLIDCIKKNKLKKIKAFFIMHNGGFNNFSREFFKIKKKYKCFIIEDACHALGAKNSLKKNDYVGNCKYVDLSTFSFHPLKSITTAEGGMTTTRNTKFYYEMLKFRNHGFQFKKNSKKKIYNWQHKLLSNSFNFRLNDIQSYLGLSQLKKLDKFIKIRNNISKIYLKKLKKLDDFIELPVHNKYYSAWHLFIIIFKKNKLKINRDKIMQLMYKYKIITQVHYIPSFKQKPFFLKNTKNFKGAKDYYSRCLSLPIYPDLKLNQIDYVVKIIETIIKKNKIF
jgi:dTDP-4-amino-4,6-dideoxygalactose transaminase